MSGPLPEAPHVSVVMPVYNGGDYLAQALDSVLAQTFTDFEIVLVNDGSRDEGHTDAVCRRYAAAHPGRIVYIVQDNAGVGAALNTAIGAMRGAVFCWLSHDDLFEPDKLERQVDFFARLAKPQAMLFSDYTLIDSGGAEVVKVRLDHATALRAPRFPLFRGWVNGCTLFIPKALFASSAPFDPQYRYVQDYRLWLELLQRAELFHQPELLVRYRVHPGQDSRRPEATTEGEALWIALVDSPNATARRQIAGCDRRFYDEMREHLLVSNYPEAAAHAEALMHRAGPDDAPAVLPGADLHPRILALRAELDERLRFVRDPRHHASLRTPVDLAALHVEHPATSAGNAAFQTGERSWAYVASLPLALADDATLLEVRLVSKSEAVFVRLVDDAYAELGERQTVTPGSQAHLWFDLDGLPRRLRLIVQAGEHPLRSDAEMVSVTVLTPDPVLGAP